MILKIKKDDYNWFYVETTCFEIYQSCEGLPPNKEDFGFSFGDVKNRNNITIERKNVSPSVNPPLNTFIETSNASILCIGEFVGFVLNDKGQTVERL